MLDETIEIFTERIKKLVLKDERMNNVPLAYLMTLDIPQSIKHFMDQEVELWLREEEQKFETSERFDYDQPQVRMLIDQIFDHLKQNAYFEITKFNHLLERAIKLELNFIVRPHRTLAQFIFKDDRVVSTIEVYDTLKYFFKFEYYKNAISDYFNTKYLREIDQEQFVDLIDQIDQKAFETDRLDTTLKTVKSIMSVIGEARQEDIEKLSVDILYDALNDRNLEDYSQLVQKVKDESEMSELTFAEIEKLLRENKLPGEEEEVEEKAEERYEDYEDIESSAPVVDVEKIEVKEPTEQIPALKKEETEEEELEEEYEEEIEEEKEQAAIKSANVASDLADHVAKQIASDSPLQDLNTMIVGRARRKILKKLFKKNEKEFSNFLEMINSEVSWKEASRIIDDVFYEREINPYSKEAIILSDIIYLRFFPKDRYVGEVEDDKFD